MSAFRTLCLALVLAILHVGNGYAQTVPTVKGVINSISSYNKTQTPEKIFIQTDKRDYNKEDTIWFKAYVFDAATLGVPVKSGLMYIEIANAENRILSRNMVNVTEGLGWGYIPLKEDKFPEGTYVVRAYTNWMRNFDERYIYTRQFTINSLQDEVWLVNSRFKLSQPEGINNVASDLTFTSNSGHSMIGEELKTRISDGRRTLYRTTLKTGIDGSTAFDFNLPDKTDIHHLNISLAKKGKTGAEVVFNVPVIINRDERTDVQFMPEGGSLLTGLLNKVAFKALNEQGIGVDISGSVYNSKQQKIADFNSTHLGMGAFNFQPDSGETYTARVDYKGQALNFKLPQAKSSGLQLSVDNATNADSVIVTVTPARAAPQVNGYYYLIGQARNVVCYGASVNTSNGQKRFAIARSVFPTGVASFTLLAANNMPVAERMVFINHQDGIQLEVSTAKAFYGMRDSVSLNLIATTKDGKPIEGIFSLAVTDDAQVKVDALGSPDIWSKLMLADDLKGYIEDPGWYFSAGETLAKTTLLDNLLLTQGWVNYKWSEVFMSVKPTLSYAAEPEFSVKGKVVNVFNKPIVKSQVVLFSNNPVLITDTLTNAAGEFAFAGLYPADTAAYKIQARNKRGRAFNVSIEVNEFKPPVFGLPQQRLIPWYVNIDTGRLGSIRARQLYDEDAAKLIGTQLREVKIKAKKSVKGSKSLVGPGEADFTLSEDDVHQAGRLSLLDYLIKNIKGFTNIGNGFKINGLIGVFIIDGMSASRFSTPNFGVKSLLEYIDAEDVKGIEVMTSGRNQMAYTSEYLSPFAKFWEYAFIEVTTYSGNGIFEKQVPGTLVYRPPIFASQKDFYSPKYTSKKADGLPDTRATIYWAPNVITDSNGRATISFYTGDKPGTYNIDIQGADMDGSVGATQSKFTVKASENQ